MHAMMINVVRGLNVSRVLESNRRRRIQSMRYRAILVLVLASVCAFAQQAPQVKSDMLVSTQWLADHLHDPKVVIIHVTMDRADYDKAHIPGARYLGGEIAIERAGVKSELPPDADLKAMFEKLGVNDESRVIIYSPHWYPVVARVYYTLDYMGHSNTALLNGSLQQWQAEGRPVNTAEDFAPSPGHLTMNARPQVRALLDEVKQISQSNDKNTVLLDSRPGKQYEESHIPGAQHLFWEDTVVDPERPVFKSPDELSKLLAQRGITPGTKVVTYCQTGWQASQTYFVLKYLGYDAQMFDGSYNQWTLEKLPTETASQVRPH